MQCVALVGQAPVESGDYMKMDKCYLSLLKYVDTFYLLINTYIYLYFGNKKQN